MERWHAERKSAVQSKKATKTSNIILAYMRNAGAPQTPSSISAALQIPKERAKKAMQRMAGDGRLVRTSRGYEIGIPAGTF